MIVASIGAAALALYGGLMAWFVGQLIFGNPKPDIRTLDGPEHPEIATRASGWLLVSSYGAGVDVLEFPSRARSHVDTANDRIREIAGPDRTGRFVYVATIDGDHELRIADVRGERDDQLFERDGDAWLDDVIGGLQLSAHGRLAFWSRPEARRGRWDRWVPPRRLEILDLDTRAPRMLDVDVARGSWSWLPDGRHLVLTRALPHRTSEPRDSRLEVTFLDVDTGEESEPLGEARIVLADRDGRILLGGLDDAKWLMHSVASSERAECPCPWTEPFAAAGPDLILATANPTTGVEVRWGGGFKVAWYVIPTLKLFDVRTCEFVTVHDWLEGHQRASFGAR